MVASKKVLPKEVEVTRLRAVTHFSVQAWSSILEYAEEIRKRYRKASKAKKGSLLDEFTQVTGLHRKLAIKYNPEYYVRSVRSSGEIKWHGKLVYLTTCQLVQRGEK